MTSGKQMPFEFATATRVIFGAGTVRQARDVVRPFGRSILLVTGSDSKRAQPLVDDLLDGGFPVTVFEINTEPTTEHVLAGARVIREKGSDMVVAFGGGKAIDAGKAIAAMAANGGDLFDYLEVIGRGRPIENAPLPFIAIPTTAGPGTEVTRNAVLVSREHKVKASLRSPLMLPKAAIIDPMLTLGLPAGITASTGADALTQLIEPFVSVRANPLIDLICRDGMQRAARALPRAFAAPGDISARTDMSLASLYGGLALANAGLGAVHGFAAPIGGMFDAPHGVVCAALLPHVMDVNIRALSERDPAGPGLARYDEIGRILTGQAGAARNDAVAWTQSLIRSLGIPRLRDVGIQDSDIPGICEKALVASSMKANPITLTNGELREILERTL